MNLQNLDYKLQKRRAAVVILIRGLLQFDPYNMLCTEILNK